jgi:hypothetical protein
METHRFRKCKRNCNKIHHNGVKYCTLHYNYYIAPYAIKIQKVFRAYKQRKLVNKMKELPEEIRCKILFYTRQDLFYKRYLDNLSNVIINRINRFIISAFSTKEKYVNIKTAIMQGTGTGTGTDIDIIVNEIYHIFYLLHKYKHIIITNHRYTEKKYKDLLLANYMISMEQMLFALKKLIWHVENKMINTYENHSIFKKYIYEFEVIDSRNINSHFQLLHYDMLY